jgi:arylsulfatase A-like enzyme
MMIMRIGIVAALGLSLATSCKSESEGVAAERTTQRKSEEPERPSARSQGTLHRPLLEEVGRAELRSSGIIINFGTSDQHKYTRGGWKTGWRTSASENPTAAAVSWAKATLDVLVEEPVRELSLRVRSAVSGQQVRAFIDNVALPAQPVSWEWSVVRVPVPDGAVKPGHRTVSLRFPKAGKVRAEVDWVWLATAAGLELPPIEPLALPVKVGGEPKRALVAPEPRSYSFYIEPGRGERLVVDVASEVGARFAIRAHVDGEKPETLFTGEGSGEWKEVAVDVGSFAGRAVRLELATEGQAGVTGWGEPALFRPARKVAAPAPAGNPRNIIYILIDTARADAFAPGSDVHTPAYDRLASQSTRFVNAYNNENWTKPSVATVLSGVYPSTHQTKTDAATLPADLEILPERLKKNGFATAGFVANGYVSDKFGFEKGWDQFRNYIRESKNSSAENVYRDGLEWLDGQKDSSERFFLYLQTIDPHVNYAVDEKYWGRYYKGRYGGFLGSSVSAADQLELTRKGITSGDDVDWLQALYKGEITYHDEHMGKFLEALEERGLLEDTLIVVSNDHGEEIGDRKGFGHGHSLYEEMITSPLLFRFPALFAAGQAIEDVVEHVDVLPTILEVLGLEPAAHADGQSVLPLVTGDPVSRPLYAISEFLDGRRSIRVGRLKLMRSSGDWMHLFDLAADPGEKEDLIAEAAIARRLCEVHLGEGLAVPSKARRQRQELVARQSFEAGEADISPEMRRRFEALGYFGARPKPQD